MNGINNLSNRFRGPIFVHKTSNYKNHLWLLAKGDPQKRQVFNVIQ